MSSQKSVCRHAHVFMSLHPCISTQLVLLVCIWVQKHVFLSAVFVHVSGFEWIHWALAVCSCIMLHVTMAMLGPSWTSSVSCHVYLLGFSPKSALCWGFTVVLGQIRFRDNSAVMDWVEMGMTCPRNISCLTEENLTALCTCQPHGSHLALLQI